MNEKPGNQGTRENVKKISNFDPQNEKAASWKKNAAFTITKLQTGL